MRGEPLSRVTQQKNTQHQGDRPGYQCHVGTGANQQRADGQCIAWQAITVDQPAGERQQEGAGEGAGQVDAAPKCMTEIKFSLDLGAEHTDKIGLAET